MKQLVICITALLLLNASSCDQSNNNCLPVTTDNSANVNEFLGLWYEHGSINQFFSVGCDCTTAEYTTSTTAGQVTVTNTCDRFGFNSDIVGFAYAPDANDFGKLKVNFPSFPGGDADYWILFFDGPGGLMLVGNPDKDNLYILSKNNTISQSDYDGLLAIAEDMCFDISKVKVTDQTNCGS